MVRMKLDPEATGHHVDAVGKDGRALVYPPRCAAGCGRFLMDSDEGTICNSCIKQFCKCAVTRVGPYRIHTTECEVVQKLLNSE